MTLSLIVPVFNSPDLVQALLGHVPDLKVVAAACGDELIEVILSDDGSQPSIAEQLSGGCATAWSIAGVPVTILRNEENLGKGHAVKIAALAAKGEWVLMSDADESAPLVEYAKLAAARAPNVWLVCGSRYVQSAPVPGLPLRRRILSRIFNLLVRLVGVGEISDTQCGFKLFWMPRLCAVLGALRITRFAFDVELIANVRKAGGLVAEVPVAWCGGHRSSLRLWRDAPQMLWDLMRIVRG